MKAAQATKPALNKFLRKQVNEFWREKARQRMRDAKLVEEGKLKWQDLSWPHILGWANGKIDWSAADAAIAADEEWEDTYLSKDSERSDADRQRSIWIGTVKTNCDLSL